ncbi:BCHE [Cordylochernes scorpioides]|uniref:Carboxylic ester hydrolase n=1 Tax=Cordylochernes scorpioides TaxID=51811 RepID=A0ABY6LB18_9ARAC|nr:BCHE [Cordylochernes scorpioides]
MVIVTVNYRVGSLEFLDLNRDGAYGNLGHKVQILAFKWVNKNIQAFGGDPDSVTLYGFSAGSVSIAFHLSLLENKGLFKRAILKVELQIHFPSVTLPDTSTVITGTQQTVSGKSLDVYLSIPYAQPPTGERRFKDPEPITNLPPYINATHFPLSCYQTFFNPKRHVNKMMSEDCLYLNIWAPSNTSKMSVLIIIYGGAFKYGSTDDYDENPQYIVARTGMVVVTVNYRVGSLGFLDLNMEGAYGNLGLKDQILAFKWVNKNIRAFGGDPDSVTLYGFSAGSVSIAFHLSIPENKGLFKRAILQSGTSNSFREFSIISMKKGMDAYYQFLNCDPKSRDVLNCLQSKSPDQIIRADHKASEANPLTTFGPQLNGKLFPFTTTLDFTKKNIILDTDIIIGMTKDETSIMTSLIKPSFMNSSTTKQEAINFLTNLLGQSNPKEFTKIANAYMKDVEEYDIKKYQMAYKNLYEDFWFRCPIFYFANIMASRNNAVFVYNFTYQTRYKAKDPLLQHLGVAHGEDREYFFGFPLRNISNYTFTEIRLSNGMMDDFGNFSRYG